MTDIALELIRPNPFRSFELHPYDEAQVERLVASIDADGFWTSVMARPVGELFELAYGHHRIEAARRFGLQSVPIEVRPLSDWQMIRMLTTENATQRGSTATATLDAVAALSYGIAWNLWRFSTDEAKIFASSPTFDYAKARTWLLAGNGIGEDCFAAALPERTFSLGQIRVAIGVLKSSGTMAEIIASATGVSVTRSEPIFDVRCARLFKLDHHLSEFRRIVTDDTVRSYLSVDQQFEFAQKIIDATPGELTAIKLRERANTIIYESIGIDRSRLRRSPLRITDDRVKDALNLMRRGASDIKRSCNLVADLIAEGADVSPEIVARFSQYVSDIETALRSLAAKGGGKRAKASNLRLIVNDGENVA